MNPQSALPRAYTVASLAAEWDCSESVIRKLVGNGEIGCFRLGTLIRIPAEEVRRFECQNIPSNDSSEAMQSSIETWPESVTVSGFGREIVLGQKRKQGGDGLPETVRRGPWAGS